MKNVSPLKFLNVQTFIVFAPVGALYHVHACRPISGHQLKRVLHWNLLWFMADTDPS